MSDLAILPLCYCAAHDGAHVHLPHMIDGQYGLRVSVLAPPPPRCEECGGTGLVWDIALSDGVEFQLPCPKCPPRSSVVATGDGPEGSPRVEQGRGEAGASERERGSVPVRAHNDVSEEG